MRRSTAAIGSAAWFVAIPGTFMVLIPWRITGGEFHRPLPYWIVAQAVGVLLICAGLVPIVTVFVQFTMAGGTPIPLAPPQHLVVTGFNRYVRNPAYVGFLMVVLGETLLFGQFGLLEYAAICWAVGAAGVRWYEEPSLTRRFGTEYEAYRRAVPAWWPRLRPWTPSERDVSGAP
jgi:protein-S-isoprenylcysteine O-methyltransferase Ste14